MSTTAAPGLERPTAPASAPPKTGFAQEPGYLFSPWIDFFCLGGATLLLIPWFALLPKDLAPYADVLVMTTAVAHFINRCWR